MEAINELTCYLRAPDVQRYVLKQIRRMKLGDALITYDHADITTIGWSDKTPPIAWRVEYRRPLEGEDHYLLIQGREPVAVQYIKSRYWLDEVQVKLAAYLVLIGFRAFNVDYLVGGEETAEDYVHNRLPHLFQFDYWYKRRDDDDDSRMLKEALESIRAITQQTLPAVFTPAPGDKALYDELQQIDRRVSVLLVEKHNARMTDDDDTGGHA